MEISETARTVWYYIEHLRFSTRLIACYLVFVLGCTIGLGVEMNPYVVLGLLMVIGGVTWKLRAYRLAKVGAIFVLFFALGLARAWISLPIGSVQGWYSFTGIVSAHPEQRSQDLIEYVIHVSELSGNILVSSSRLASFGDRVRVDCGITVLSKETFLRYWQLRSRGVHYACSKNAHFEIVERKAARLYAALADTKQEVEGGISKHIPEPERTLALGILLGERGDSQSRLTTAMRRVGLSHIAVVSGYNVALVGAFIFAGMFLFGLGRRAASLLTVAALVVFTLFVGLDPSVLRSVIMYSVTLGVYFLDRPKLGFYSLCLVAFILLIVNPFLIRNVSFLLSFASVAGLSLTTEFWENVFKRVDETLREFLVPTFAAQTGALPVVIWYFGSVSLISPLTNVFVLPLIPFAMALSFGTWLLSLVSFPYSGWISYPLLTTITHVAFWFADVPFAQIQIRGAFVKAISIMILVGVYVAVIFRRRLFLKLGLDIRGGKKVEKEKDVEEVVFS